MTFDVTSPERMNATFANAFNSRNVGNLLALYEPGPYCAPMGQHESDGP